MTLEITQREQFQELTLPQVRSEDLNQRDLQSGDLTVHENTSQIELDLETNVDIGSVDGGRPPHSESTIGNLRKTGTLGVSQSLVFHTRTQNTTLTCLFRRPEVL